jgi:K+-transporting ATPase KdpF subunit
LSVLVCLLGLHQGLRQAVGDSPRENIMDYIIAGITSLGLFVYLLYALLRPEKF